VAAKRTFKIHNSLLPGSVQFLEFRGEILTFPKKNGAGRNLTKKTPQFQLKVRQFGLQMGKRAYSSDTQENTSLIIADQGRSCVQDESLSKIRAFLLNQNASSDNATSPFTAYGLPIFWVQ